MNLPRHIQVLKSGRVILALGLLLAIALAILATFRVSVDGGPKLSYRKPETWSATTKLLVTQPGFPWGRSVLPGSADGGGTVASDAAATGSPADDKGQVQFADPSRLAYLSWIYSHFLMGDEVRTMLSFKPEGMDIEASPLTAGGSMSAAALPIIGLTTSATSAADARRLNDEVRSALDEYLAKQQRQSATPVVDRIVTSVVDRPAPVLVKKHSPNLGVVAFLLIMSATFSLIYIRENLRQHRSSNLSFWNEGDGGERPLVSQDMAAASGHSRGVERVVS